jgi:hypothetical protein
MCIKHMHQPAHHAIYKHSTTPHTTKLIHSMMTPNTVHQAPRVHLLNTTFYKALPKRYSKIARRWSKVARLHRIVSSALTAFDRAARIDALNVGIELLEHDIEEYRQIVNSIEVEDIAHLYMVVGRQRCEAEEMAREDFQDLEGSLTMLEEKIREVKVRVENGFVKEELESD